MKNDYDLDAMRGALKQCDNNIKTFEEAIEREQDTKREYRRIITELEKKADLDVEKAAAKESLEDAIRNSLSKV